MRCIELGADLPHIPQPLTNTALELLSLVVFAYSYMASLIKLLLNS